MENMFWINAKFHRFIIKNCSSRGRPKIFDAGDWERLTLYSKIISKNIGIEETVVWDNKQLSTLICTSCHARGRLQLQYNLKTHVQLISSHYLISLNLIIISLLMQWSSHPYTHTHKATFRLNSELTYLCDAEQILTTQCSWNWFHR